MLIEGIDVKGVSDNHSWIKLPKMYTRTGLPVNREEIAIPDKIKQWDNSQTCSNDHLCMMTDAGSAQANSHTIVNV